MHGQRAQSGKALVEVGKAHGGGFYSTACSEHPFYGQCGQEPDDASFEHANLRLRVVPDLLPVLPLDPVNRPFVRQPYFVGASRNILVKGGFNFASHFGAFNNEAELSIQFCRARVEIERAHEDALPIDGEGLGVQARTRTAKWRRTAASAAASTAPFLFRY